MIKVAVPDNPIYSVLYENIDSVSTKYGIEFLKVSEQTCIDMIFTNRVDMALMNPYGYGKGLNVADFRIIPNHVMALNGYTGLASVFFKENLKNIETCAVPTKEDFLVKMAMIILTERFGIEPNITEVKSISQDILKEFDLSIQYRISQKNDISLDVSEDWLDTFEIPLPLAFWVCRVEEHPVNFEDVTRELAQINLQKEIEVIEENPIEGQLELRSGTILTHWSNEIEHALEQTLQILYFHQLFNEIPAIKLLGRD